jgi:hypothetical protein
VSIGSWWGTALPARYRGRKGDSVEKHCAAQRSNAGAWPSKTHQQNNDKGERLFELLLTDIHKVVEGGEAEREGEDHQHKHDL